jgi:hypothetical protein
MPPPARRKRTSLARPCTRKSRLVSSGWSMSALPPKADIRQRIEHVRFVPKADISARPLFLVVSRTTPRFVCLGSPADIGSISAIRFTPRLQRYSASKSTSAMPYADSTRESSMTWRAPRWQFLAASLARTYLVRPASPEIRKEAST